MPFQHIAGQEDAIGFLREMAARERVPSALLFHGPPQVGKRRVALALAQWLNCLAPQPADACGQCPSCRKIEEGLHPDVLLVEPEGQFIKIDQVREISRRLNMIPFEARRRVVVLAEAERMNPQAANAFLKTLEEPPLDTLIVLVSGNASRLPDTILSRCMGVRFGLLGGDLVAQALAGGLSGEELAFAVRFSQGRVKPGLRENAGRLMALRDDLIHGLEKPSGAAFEVMADRLAQWAAGGDLDFVLEWLETWFHDLALLGAGAREEWLINADRMPQLNHWLGRTTPERAARCHRDVLATRADLALNNNKTLALEALWFSLKREVN
ncbi:MAG: DNA polymerase III subunit delta' [Deltaproteobacteria bacterium]|nr:DNA polymerase III subunit delta' [Deltaproteobacteria bacterium]